MFVDEIQDAVLSDQPWQTADNYSSAITGISDLHLDVSGG
jgi:hypothetical protein